MLNVVNPLLICYELLHSAQVVVLRKRDFLDLDNPLLAWMLDYDAVSAVLKALPAFKKLKQEQMEHIFDRCAQCCDVITCIQSGDGCNAALLAVCSQYVSF
jgi:hypothetical protein